MNEIMNINGQEVIEGKFRDVNTITEEINSLYREGCRMLNSLGITYAIEIGKKLQEVKDMLQHGEWGEWLKENVQFSQSKANKMMAVYKKFGEGKASFLEGSNSEKFTNLGISQAFLLLPMPDDEVEEFVEKNDVENMSTQELKNAIAERDAAKAEQKRAEAELDKLKTQADALGTDNKMLRESNIELNKKAQSAGKDIENARKEAAEAKQRAADADLKISKEKEAAREAMNREKALREELEKLKNNPAVPDEVIEKIKAEAEKAAKETAEKENMERERKITELEKKLSMASPEIAVFKTYFTQLQETQKRIAESIEKIRESDGITADKLKEATMAAEKAFIARVNGNL